MDAKKLKYEFSVEEVKALLNILNRVQIVGIQSAQTLLILTQKLQSPSNAEEIEQEQLEVLKTKYEKKD